MSIIMRNISGGSGTGSSKGFPPGDVYNASVRSGVKCVKLQWSDPDNTTIEGGVTLSTWSSTIIVRKEGSTPTSIKDGDVVLTNTIKNTYSSTPYTDNNVTVGKTYYYRFYTLSTDKVYNDSTSMIYSIKAKEYDPILKNNSWENIIEASEVGAASSLWKVGDEIDLTLSGYYNETVTLQIWDFNHFDKTDGTGKAGICFGMKNLMKNDVCLDYDGENVSSSWEECGYRSNTIPKIINSMPSSLQNGIKEVNTYAYGIKNGAGNIKSTDKIFLPSIVEIHGNTDYRDYAIESERSSCSQFPIFTNNNSRIKKTTDNQNGRWWTRSYATNTSYSYAFYYIYTDGTKYTYNAWREEGICFCFNV